MRAYSPIGLVNFYTSFTQQLMFRDYLKLFALGIRLVISLVIYTGLLPVILCYPKSQRIRVFQLTPNFVSILLRIDRLMLNLVLITQVKRLNPFKSDWFYLIFASPTVDTRDYHKLINLGRCVSYICALR